MADVTLDTLFYDLEARTAGFDAAIAKARKTLRELGSGPAAPVKVGADTVAAEAGLERVKKKSRDVGAEKPKIKPDVDTTAAEAKLQQLKKVAREFGGEFDVAGRNIGTTVARITEVMGSSAVAAGALATAVASVAIVATNTAAEFDKAFRRIRAALPSDAGAIGTLQREIVALSTSTPRTVTELSALAEQLAKVGETDPGQIANDLKVIATAADALGQSDAGGFVELLDGIADSFQLTSAQARDAFLQIVSLTKGKIAIEDLSSAFGKGATSIATFTNDAVGAARALTTLIDANINSRKLIPSVLGILEQSAQALVKADQAAAAGQAGSARALRDFAGAVNTNAINTKGLLPVLGDLYHALGESAQNFAAAGLSADQFTIAQRAAAAASDGVAMKAETAREAMDKLQGAAALNNESAAALTKILKNELSAALGALGATFLPPVLDLMRSLADRFNEARRNAKLFSESVKSIGPASFDNLSRREKEQIITNTVGGARALVATPSAADGLSAQELAERINSYAKLRDIADEIGKTAAVPAYVAALDVLVAKLGEVGEAQAATANAAKAAADKAKKDDLSTKYQNAAAGAKAAAKEVAALLERFEEATRASSEYAESLGRAEQPIEAASRRQAALARELDALIEKLPVAKQAAARDVKATILEQLAEGAERLRAVKATELVESLDKTIAGFSGDAIAALSAEYRTLTETLQRTAEAGDALGNETGRAQAARARAIIPLVEKERDALIALEKEQRRFNDAVKVLATFDEQKSRRKAGAVIKDEIVQITDRNRAIQELQILEAELTEQVKQGLPTVKAQTEAEAQLLEVREQLKGLGAGSQTTAQIAQGIGEGLASAAQSGLALVQVLGQGNSRLASMLAGVGSLGQGIERISALAQKAGGFGKLFSTGAGVASGIGAATSIVGGVVAVAQALDLFGSQARERARQIRDAGLAFNAALDAFVVKTGSALQQSIDSQFRQITDLAKQYARDIGLDTGTVSFRNAADLRKQITDVTTIGEDSGLPVGIREKYLRYRDALVTSLALIEENTAALKEQATVEIARLTDSLAVRRLVLGGLTEEANALRNQIDLDAEIAALREKYRDVEGVAIEEYITELRKVTAAEIAAADAIAARTAALSQLDDELAILGGTSLEQLTRTLGTLTELFPELAGITDGLDLGTAEGLSSLTERLRDLFRTLSADGISESERPLVDAIRRILGVIESASGDLPDALDPFAAALEAFAVRVEVFGLSAKEQLQGLAAIFAGKFPDLDEILGSADLTTESGRTALQKKLQEAIGAILSDGVITAEEAPFLEALQRFFGLVGGVIDESTRDAERAANEAAEARQRRVDAANAEIAIRDLTGADAFAVRLRALGPAFQDLFGAFDLSSIEGVTGAKDALWALLQGIDDGTISLEQFGDMTREEIIAAILGLDSSLDGLKDSALAAAEAARKLAEEQKDFTDSVDDEYLRATGSDREADIAAAKRATEQRIARAKELGLSQAVIDKIIRAGALRINSINARYDAADQQAIQEALRDVEAAVPTTETRRSEFVASAVTQISSRQALQIADYLSAGLVEQRATRVAAQQIAALMGAMISGTIPALSVPAFPPGTGVGARASAPGLTLVVNFNGPLTGLTPQQAADEFVRNAGPALDEYLGRATSNAARAAGRTIT